MTEQPEHQDEHQPAPRRTLAIIVLIMTGIALGWIVFSPAIKPSVADIQHQRWLRAHPEIARMRKYAVGNNTFACDLYQVSRAGKTGDFCFSPFSISAAFAMIHAGARGETRRQITETMHFDLPEQELYSAIADQCAVLEQLNDLATAYEDYSPQGIKQANSLWVADTFALVPEYQQLIEETFNGGLATVDFNDKAGVVEQVNQWTDERTGGLITEVLSEEDLTPDSSLIVVNGLAFNQAWFIGFQDSGFRKMDFHTSRESIKTVPTIDCMDELDLALTKQFAAIRLPVGCDRRISLVVVLPEEIEGLPALEDALRADLIAEINRNFQSAERVEVSLPKFEVNQRLDLSETLKGMGIVDAFTTSADLTGIGTSDHGVPLMVESAIQEVRTIVDEAGIAAAVVTVVTSGCLCGDRDFEPPPDDYVFTADHPFLFLIQDDETETILFIGRVMDPEYTVERDSDW